MSARSNFLGPFNLSPPKGRASAAPSTKRRSVSNHPPAKGVARSATTYASDAGATADVTSATLSDGEGLPTAEAERLQVIKELQLILRNRDRSALAEALGVSEQTIGMWTSPSSGKGIPYHQVRRIAMLFGPALMESGVRRTGYFVIDERGRTCEQVGRCILELYSKLIQIWKLAKLVLDNAAEDGSWVDEFTTDEEAA